MIKITGIQRSENEKITPNPKIEEEEERWVRSKGGRVRRQNRCADCGEWFNVFRDEEYCDDCARRMS